MFSSVVVGCGCSEIKNNTAMVIFMVTVSIVLVVMLCSVTSPTFSFV